MGVSYNPGYGAPRRRPVNYNDRNALATEQGSQYSTAAGYGDQANADYLHGAENFDASKSLNTYAKGAFGSISNALNTQINQIKGSAVGAGRFDSGFVDQDSTDATTRIMNDFSNNIAQQSLGAAQLQQRNTEGLAQFGQGQQGTANDLLASRREELENNAREEEQRKRQKRAGIGGAIGGVLGAAGGFIAGGPAGAMGGYKAGSAIGSAF